MTSRDELTRRVHAAIDRRAEEIVAIGPTPRGAEPTLAGEGVQAIGTSSRAA